MGRLCESGILKDFLDENCEEQNYSICKYKDELPKTALEFVWNDNSPYKKDTLYLFEADKEYASIVKKIYTSPKYWFRLFVVEGFNQTWKQCYTMRIGHGLWQHKEDGGFYRHFERVFPEETDNYKKSKQFKNKLNFDFINLQNKLTLITSLFVIIITLVIFKLPKTYYQLTFFTIIGYIINAGISANLANVSYRLGGRAAWLIVFIALIYICGIVTNLFTINPFFTKFTRKNLSPHKQK